MEVPIQALKDRLDSINTFIERSQNHRTQLHKEMLEEEEKVKKHEDAYVEIAKAIALLEKAQGK